MLFCYCFATKLIVVCLYQHNKGMKMKNKFYVYTTDKEVLAYPIMASYFEGYDDMPSDVFMATEFDDEGNATHYDYDELFDVWVNNFQSEEDKKFDAEIEYRENRWRDDE